MVNQEWNNPYIDMASYSSLTEPALLQGQRGVRKISKFIAQLYGMANNPENSAAVGFSEDGLCLEIRDVRLLCSQVLRRYFDHDNLKSLTRQLNNYGFKSIPPGQGSKVSHVSVHPYFRRGRRDLLSNISRRCSGSSSSSPGGSAVDTRPKRVRDDSSDDGNESSSSIATAPTPKLEMMRKLVKVNLDLVEESEKLREENERIQREIHGIHRDVGISRPSHLHQNSFSRVSSYPSLDLDSKDHNEHLSSSYPYMAVAAPHSGHESINDSLDLGDIWDCIFDTPLPSNNDNSREYNALI